MSGEREKKDADWLKKILRQVNSVAELGTGTELVYTAPTEALCWKDLLHYLAQQQLLNGVESGTYCIEKRTQNDSPVVDLICRVNSNPVLASTSSSDENEGEFSDPMIGRITWTRDEIRKFTNLSNDIEELNLGLHLSKMSFSEDSIVLELPKPLSAYDRNDEKSVLELGTPFTSQELRDVLEKYGYDLGSPIFLQDDERFVTFVKKRPSSQDPADIFDEV